MHRHIWTLTEPSFTRKMGVKMETDVIQMTDINTTDSSLSAHYRNVSQSKLYSSFQQL